MSVLLTTYSALLIKFYCNYDPNVNKTNKSICVHDSFNIIRVLAFSCYSYGYKWTESQVHLSLKSVEYKV